jgi:chromosome segregation ATPase
MKLPDCMMPDGAEPCKGYQELQAESEQLRRDLEIWKRNGGDILQRAEIEQLKIDVEHWKTEDANGTALVLQLSAEVDQLCAEKTDLQEQIATCRELRQYDRSEIERMRHLLSGAKP